MNLQQRKVALGLMSLASLAALLSCAHSEAAQNTHHGPNAQTDEPTIAQLEARARAREVGERNIPQNDLPRKVDGEVECPHVELVEYAGARIPYNRPVKVTRDFRQRLMRFETIVAEVAIEVYGRAPDRIVQRAGYACKTIGHRKEKLSEHAFGQAIDVAGFDFEALPKGKDTELVTGRAREAFQVRLAKYWSADEGFAAQHSLFLHRLAEELERRGPFSTMLGPSYKGHERLFHFDFGPQFFFRL